MLSILFSILFLRLRRRSEACTRITVGNTKRSGVSGMGHQPLANGGPQRNWSGQANRMVSGQDTSDPETGAEEHFVTGLWPGEGWR